MARISTEELSARLEKDKKIPGILLLGDERYLRDKCRALLIERFVDEAARTWAVSRFSADRGETQAALEQAQTLPMLSPRQVIFLEEAEAIEALGEKNRKETVEGILAYSERSGPVHGAGGRSGEVGYAYAVGQEPGGRAFGCGSGNRG